MHQAKLPRNVIKCNFQTTGPEGHPSIPETDTVIERPNLVQNGQILPSSCCKTAFECILLHLRAGKKAKMHHLRMRIVRRKKMSKAHMHVLHSGHSGGLFAGASSPFLLSLSPSFFFFSLSPPSFSLRFVFKNRFGKAFARKAATRMVWRASWVNLRAVDACEASLLRSEASLLRSEASKTQKPTKSTVARKRSIFLKDTPSVSKDKFHDMFD